MPYQHDPNDTKALTPLLIMGIIVVCGLIFYAYFGHAPSPHS